MKKFFSLVLCLLLPLSMQAANTLQSYPTATVPAGNDWLYLSGDTFSVRKLAPSYFTSAAAFSSTISGLSTLYQPLSANLTSLASVTGTNVFFYRAPGGNWLPVNLSGLTFNTGTGTLTASGSVWGGIGGTIGNQSDLTAALALKASLASPALTGVPTAPTAANGTNTTQLATTAFVLANSSTGVAWGGITGTLSAQSDLNSALALKSPLASPAFTGVPTGPTASFGTNTTQLATTAFVLANEISSSAWGSITGTLSSQTDLNTALGLKAPAASPTFTGTVVLPSTTAIGSVTGTEIGYLSGVTSALQTQLNAKQATLVSATNIKTVNGTSLLGSGDVPISGTAAWGSITGTLTSQTDLNTALGLKAPLASPSLTGVPLSTTAAVDTNTTQIATTAFVLAQAASANPVIDGTAAPGTSTRYARGDHVHPTDTTRAALASPTFTGVPAAPTATAATNTTQLATTAFVTTADNLKANIASPTFTGVPAAPTAAAGTSTTQLATTAFVTTALIPRTAQTITQTAHGFVAGNVLYNVNGTWTKARANALSTSTPTAVVESVTTNDFVAVYSGPITLSALTASSVYYLSDATAGLTTTTAPTTTTSFVVPIFTTGTTTGAIVNIGQPAALAGVNLSTDVNNVLPAANGGTGVANTGTSTLTANLTVNAATVLNRQSSTGLPVEFYVAASDLTTALTTGTNKAYFRAPYAFTVTEVRASVLTAQSSGSLLTFNIKESGTTILSTKITLDNTETTSVTAATPPVISDTSIADDAIVSIDVDQVGTGPAGAIILIKGYR
jgi:hypothetical protein